MQPVVKIEPTSTGPFPTIERGSLICHAKSGANPMILLVVEIVGLAKSKCMVIHEGDSGNNYGETGYWDHTDFAVWRGTLTLTQ